MVERVVLIKLEEEWATDDGRREVADHSAEALAAVPGVRRVEVLLPADGRSGKDWDLCLRIGFDRIEDVPPYVEDPAHRRYVDDYLRPRTVVIKAWNFGPPKPR